MGLFSKKAAQTTSDPANVPDDDSNGVGPEESSAAPEARSSRTLSGKKLWSAFAGFMISVLLVNLDQTIVATALPRIASQFNALQQSAWIATSYLLTLSGFILILGQVLTMVPAKNVFLVSLFVFELGSLICATSHSFPNLLVGRAIAGCGGAGIMDSVMVIVAQDTDIKDRPILFGFLGTMYALSSIIGPLIGGALTDRATWRWCFFLNLPLGGIALVLVFFLLEAQPPLGSQYANFTRWRKWAKLDWFGGVLCIGAVASLLLAMQWGGAVKPWNSATIIALFCVFGVCLFAFLGMEWYQKLHAILPLSLFSRRTQTGASLEAFFLGMGLLSGTYYLPLWYQAQGHSATKSGIDILPFMLSTVIAMMISGGLIKMTGRFWHILVLAPLLCSVGAGLLSSLNPDASNARLIGFQILYGVGLGGALQNMFIAVQAEWADDEKMIPQATTLLTFVQLLGGAIGVAIGGSVFSNQLHINILKYAPDLSPDLVAALEQSVTVIQTLEGTVHDQVLEAYVRSVDRTFLLGVPAGALASFSALLVRNVSVTESVSKGLRDEEKVDDAATKDSEGSTSHDAEKS